ncbi:MAG: GIY-YIG nuclease family protein [Bacteroidaceae bacterium]|nr:GIY-YIG nuclease family protein [Bacteroidaceae bacterium]
MSTLNNNENIGVIYVMKCLDYIKIGKAKIGSTRFGEYTRLMSKPEYILRVIVKNYHDFEKEIHKKYENYRTNGEWYLFNKNTLNKVVSFIKSHSIMNYNETDEFEFDANQIKIVEKGIIDIYCIQLCYDIKNREWRIYKQYHHVKKCKIINGNIDIDEPDYILHTNKQKLNKGYIEGIGRHNKFVTAATLENALKIAEEYMKSH